MTTEQVNRIVEQLERIADSLEVLSDLAMDRDTLKSFATGEGPVLLKAIDHIADMAGIGK